MSDTIISPGSLVLDIGAHHGESADKFLNHHGAGRVVCVEADLENYARLVQHWRDDDRVVPIHAAVMARHGIARIHRCASQDGLSTTRHTEWQAIYPDAVFEAPRPVVAIGVDDLLKHFGRPDHVKVDVEGAERDVLAGLWRALDLLPRTISIEFHGAYMAETHKCLHELAGLGYRRAHYVTEDADLREALSQARPVQVVAEELLDQLPEWGNVTLMP